MNINCYVLITTNTCLSITDDDVVMTELLEKLLHIVLYTCFFTCITTTSENYFNITILFLMSVTRHLLS